MCVYGVYVDYGTSEGETNKNLPQQVRTNQNLFKCSSLFQFIHLNVQAIIIPFLIYWPKVSSSQENSLFVSPSIIH